MPLEVIMISAPWCARCGDIKPGVEQTCKSTGAIFTVLNYDDLEDDDAIKQQVSALPTLLIDGKAYKPAYSDEWREVLAAAAVAAATAGGGDMDF